MMRKSDNDLIFLCSENARMKIRDMAGLLGKSSQRLKYSLRLLDKEGIIRNSHCIFDYSFFGLILFRIYFKGVYIGEKEKQNIIDRLKEDPYIVSIYELSGEFDLAAEMESPNPSRFNKELKRIINSMPTLNNYKIILNIVTHIYPKVYLIKDEKLMKTISPDIIVGGDRTTESFSENEMNIMKNILLTPRTRLTKLADKSSLNVKTVVSTIKGLRERQIIKGFKFQIDVNRLGIYKHRLFLKLHNVSTERENQLIDYFFRTNEIVQVNKTVGDWDIEVDIESLNKGVIRYLTMQIREEFKDMIETFNMIEFYQYHKKTYLPSYLFSRQETAGAAPKNI